MDTCPLTNQPCERRRVLHVTDVSKGKAVAAVDLCDRCGAEFVASGLPIIACLKQLLKKQAKSFVDAVFSAPDTPPVPKCPKCGWTLDDITRAKRMGCPACYDFFDASALLRSVHGAEEHVGKRPVVGAKRQDRPVDTVTATGVASRIIEANQAMREAAMREDYAEAARMRDLVRGLSPILELVEECEKKVHEDPAKADEVASQIKTLQQDYEKVLHDLG